ncbi:hypothetical protein Ppa06_57580 [Planomonospora parontospora subsp. parontospora]|uniref:DUF397 domain-containing protein n=2 Tax=Planomonospora parontospora TaxID=58119 RepID=A0AA37BM08_9ACTN|nr:DUF397 domain-containing protein [Planomonospora parontospora]GGK90751.1 hypothetical protein GCM10010126_57730 [Planomonospora parontospora]GII11960.1 hypothetical protein Ppa06_57580 [Planomonospora parontospora subsp. parontospora]
MLTSQWITASESGGCVEVRLAADGLGVEVRDTKDAGKGPVLTFTEGEWRDFTRGVRRDVFDHPRWVGAGAAG